MKRSARGTSGLRFGFSGHGGKAAKFCSFDGVAHEHGDGHWTDPAGNGSEGASGVYSVGMDVANQHAALGCKFSEARGKVGEQALGFNRIGDFVGPDVDDRSAGLNPLGLDKTGASDGGDEDVGVTDDFGKFARFGMADGDGGVGVEEQESHRFANDVAAPEDDGVGTFDRNVIAAQNFHAASRSAGD